MSSNRDARFEMRTSEEQETSKIPSSRKSQNKESGMIMTTKKKPTTYLQHRYTHKNYQVVSLKSIISAPLVLFNSSIVVLTVPSTLLTCPSPPRIHSDSHNSLPSILHLFEGSLTNNLPTKSLNSPPTSISPVLFSGHEYSPFAIFNK